MRKFFASLVISFLIIGPADAQSRAGGFVLVPPAIGPIARHFERPGSDWGPGHRGIDIAVPAGSPVGAGAPGTVTFAGRVGNVVAVTIAHGDGIESTYSSLSEIAVDEGDAVVAGTTVGTSGETHLGGGEGLHLGVKVTGVYVDPLDHLSLDVGSAFSLVPVVPEDLERLMAKYGFDDLSVLSGGCTEAARLKAAGAPPNDNVGIAVAGLGSRTAGGVSAEIYRGTLADLGYPARLSYHFSYRGTKGTDLHEPYLGVDTYGDIRVAAERLRELMLEVAARHPGRAVDLIAHSQGGIVARAYLDLVSRDADPQLPRVEHLVTYSSPHGGAPLAGVAQELKDRSGMGRLALQALSSWAQGGGSLPDPLSKAVEQLAPGSALLGALDEVPLPFGTRGLTIAIPNDVIVPADRADLDGAQSKVVAPRSLDGHDGVVASSATRSATYSFLAGATELCRGAWDTWGPIVGRATSFVEGLVPALVTGVVGLL